MPACKAVAFKKTVPQSGEKIKHKQNWKKYITLFNGFLKCHGRAYDIFVIDRRWFYRKKNNKDNSYNGLDAIVVSNY